MPSPSHRSHRIICTGNFSRNNNNGDITTATIEFFRANDGRGKSGASWSLFPFPLCVSGPSLGRIYLSRSGCFQPNPHTGTKGVPGTERHLFIRPCFPLTADLQLVIGTDAEDVFPFLGTWFPPESGSMAIRYCSFATRGYHLRQWMQMMSLRLADSSVELSCWNLNRLEREGIRGGYSMV